MRPNKYVVTYHVSKHKFGSSIKALKEHAIKHGLFGTAVFYYVREDGSWELMSFVDISVEEGEEK